MTGYASSTPLIIANVGPTQPSDPVVEVLPRVVVPATGVRGPARGCREQVNCDTGHLAAWRDQSVAVRRAVE